MKSRRTHLDRQIQHSYELGIVRDKKQARKEDVLYLRIGWGIMILWGMLSVIWGVLS